MRISEFKAGVAGGIPIALGYLSVSFAYGISAAEGGIDPLSAVMISMTNLTSAGQVAGTQMIIAMASYLQIAITTLVINLRYMLMSMSLSQRVEPEMNTPQRMLVSFGITDEIFAVAYQREQTVSTPYMLGLISLPYIGWTLGTLMGSVAGNILPAMLRSALGIAIYGMFVAIVIPQCRKGRAFIVVAALAALLSCCIFYIPVLSAVLKDWSIIICTAIASVLGAILFPVEEVEA